jgi:hypothetical protein
VISIEGLLLLGLHILDGRGHNLPRTEKLVLVVGKGRLGKS